MIFVYVVAAVLALGVLVSLVFPEEVTALGLRLERRLSGLSLHHARVDGFEMPYLEGGTGAPLLLIHGFGGDKDNFTRVARLLTPHYRVIIPDLPGFGDATRDARASYTIADQVGRIHAFLRQLGIERVHLGGNSMGGFIAAQFAAPYGHMVDSLWLLDPSGTEAAYDTPMIQHYLKTGESPFFIDRVADFENIIGATTHKKPFIPRVARTALGLRAVRDRALHTMIMRAMNIESPLLEKTFPPMPTPALIVWGEHDQVLNPKGAQAMRQLFPHSQVIIMPGIGHVPMVEAPRETAEAYLAYRRSLQGAV